MRFSPDGRHVAYTAWTNGNAVTVVDVVTGSTVAQLPAGLDPRWAGGDRSLVARSPDGIERSAIDNGYQCEYVPANQGDMDASNRRVAYGPDRATGMTAFWIQGDAVASQLYPSTFEPALSPGGTLALRDLASGYVRLERITGCTDAVASQPSLGPSTRVRWSSQSLVWDTIPYGRVFGRTSPDQGDVELTIPGRTCTHPVALWTGSYLYVGLVLDDGILVLAEWGQLARHDGMAWAIATSGGSAFDWDIAYGGGTVVRIAYNAPGGTLVLDQIDTRLDAQTHVGVLPPDPEPPDPEPPDPPDPEPEPMPQNWPPLKAIPRDQVVMMCDALDGYLKVNPRLGLPTGLIDCSKPTLAEQIDALIAYGVNECLGHFQEEGPLPGTAEEYAARRQRAQDYTVHVIENERGEKPPPPEPGTLQGPIGVDGSNFTVPG